MTAPFHDGDHGSDLVHQIYVNQQWTTVHPRAESGLDIQRGRQREGVALPDYQTCDMTLDNRSGDLSLDNPMGAYWATLKRNTPHRVLEVMDTQLFTTPVTDSWGSTRLGETFTLTGSGGTVQNSDWQVTGGTGTIRIPAANATRAAHLTNWVMENLEVRAEVRWSVSDVTGGELYAGIEMRRQSASLYYWGRVTVKTDEHVWLEIIDGTGFIMWSVDTGIIHTGQWLAIAMQTELQTIRCKIWDPATQVEPYFWQFAHDHEVRGRGYVGFRAMAASGNSNAKPVTASWRNVQIISPRFHGEIPAFPNDWDTTGRDAWVDAQSAGILKRLGKGGQLKSTLRQSLPGVAGLVAYWPGEEGSEATTFASAFPNHQPIAFADAVPTFAGYSGFDCSLPIPTVNGARWRGQVPFYTETGAISLRFLLHLPSSGVPDQAILAQIFTTGTAAVWELIYGTGGSVSIRVFDSAGTFVTTQGPFAYGLDDAQVRFCYDLQQDGADVDWLVSAPEVGGVGAGFNAGTLAGYTIGRCADVRFVVGNPGLAIDNIAIGHITVQSQITNLFDVLDELNAFTGERSGYRIRRLVAQETGSTISFTDELSETALMGPQRPATLLSHLAECVETDLGTLYESRMAFELVYRGRRDNYGQAAKVALDLANHELVDPFKPVPDDDVITNKVSVSNVSGSSYTAEQTTGRMGSAPPPSGIGLYDTSHTVNVLNEGYQLPGIAEWLLAQGTVEEARFRAITVELARSVVSNNLPLSRALMDFDIDHRVTVDNAQSRNIYDLITQLGRGYRERIGGRLHTLEVVAVPESPFQTGVLDATPTQRLDSATSTLELDVDGSATSFTVAVGDSTLWTEDVAHFPFDVRINGEEMTVTGISTVTPSFVAAGTAAHADNTSITPGLPAGIASGDMLLALTAVRDTNARVTYAGSDWFLVLDGDWLRLWIKQHPGSGSAPTFGVSGGSAGVTVSGQLCAFRNMPLTRRAASQLFNASAQNIGTPGLYAPNAKGMLITAGWKQDDWTSVAALTGATEIGEPSSTVGNDQGLVWDYRAYTGVVAGPAQSFVVTGGGAAISRSFSVLFGNWQTFTVVRGVNGVQKAHPAGSAVRVSRPFRPGL